jgi:hypothetical protein
MYVKPRAPYGTLQPTARLGAASEAQCTIPRAQRTRAWSKAAQEGSPLVERTSLEVGEARLSL